MKKTKKTATGKQKSLLRTFMMGLTFFFIVLLLICYLSPIINPQRFALPALIGLAYPFLVVINFVFAIIWLAYGSKRAVLPFLAIAIGFQPLLRHIQFNFIDKKASKEQSLNIMTFNVRLFDYYNHDKPDNVTAQIYAFLKDNNADILCFQEFFNKDGREFPVVPTLETVLQSKGHHIDYYTTRRKTDHYGLATFTRLPIIDTGHILTPETHGNYAIYTDLRWKNDTIRVYNIHMASMHFSPEDYNFYHEITTQKSDNQGIKSGSIKIAGKLINAFKKRGIQADMIAEHIKKCPYPVIICGDFNDSPCSYTYHKLSGDLKDAFVESGYGLGKTYSGSFPSLRIDYILYDKRYQAVTYKTHHQMLSDHYPVSAKLIHREL
ncbi:MAG: endonuclease/exonuclease/phosphatase family protein [Bacteroidota bacterium]